MENKLNEYIESYQNCVKCGKCLPVCPSYNYSLNEFLSPRGRVRLIAAKKKDEQPLLASKFEKTISTCLLCGRCSALCPNDVKTEIMVAGEKIQLSKLEGKHFSIDNFALKALKSNRKFLLQTGLRLSNIVKIQNRYMPEPEGFPFTLHTNLNFSSKTEKIKVGYFSGCVFNTIYPKVSTDTITALNKNDVSVFVPSSQSCCGLPHISSGDIESFKELAINNATAFKDKEVEYIITSCASCSYSIGKLYPLYFNEENQSYNNDSNYKEVVDFSKKLIDIWTFFNILRKKGVQIKKGKLQQGMSVAFHIPCHLKNADDFKASSKNEKLIGEAGLIIDNIEGLELKPLKHNYCCGNGGMFNVRHYEMSKEITRKKFEEIKEASPQTVVTSCSGCMFSLKDQKGIMKKPEEIPVKHLIELYAKSLLD